MRRKIIISLIIISMLIQENFIFSEAINSKITIQNNTIINKNIALQSFFAQKYEPRQKEILQETLQNIQKVENSASIFDGLLLILRMNGVKSWNELLKRFVNKEKDRIQILDIQTEEVMILKDEEGNYYSDLTMLEVLHAIEKQTKEDFDRLLQELLEYADAIAQGETTTKAKTGKVYLRLLFSAMKKGGEVSEITRRFKEGVEIQNKVLKFGGYVFNELKVLINDEEDRIKYEGKLLELQKKAGYSAKSLFTYALPAVINALKEAGKLYYLKQVLELGVNTGDSTYYLLIDTLPAIIKAGLITDQDKLKSYCDKLLELENKLLEFRAYFLFRYDLPEVIKNLQETNNLKYLDKVLDLGINAGGRAYDLLSDALPEAIKALNFAKKLDYLGQVLVLGIESGDKGYELLQVFPVAINLGLINKPEDLEKLNIPMDYLKDFYETLLPILLKETTDGLQILEIVKKFYENNGNIEDTLKGLFGEKASSIIKELNDGNKEQCKELLKLVLNGSIKIKDIDEAIDNIKTHLNARNPNLGIISKKFVDFIGKKSPATYIFDVDGTLTDTPLEEKKLTPKTIKLLICLLKMGKRIVLASGREEVTLKQVKQQIEDTLTKSGLEKLGENIEIYSIFRKPDAKKSAIIPKYLDGGIVFLGDQGTKRGNDRSMFDCKSEMFFSCCVGEFEGEEPENCMIKQGRHVRGTEDILQEILKIIEPEQIREQTFVREILDLKLEEGEIISKFPIWGKESEGKMTHGKQLSQHLIEVAENVKKNPEYQKLSDEGKMVAIMSALFHDIGKDGVDAEHPFKSAEIVKRLLTLLHITGQISQENVLKILSQVTLHHWSEYVSKGKGVDEKMKKYLTGTLKFKGDDYTWEKIAATVFRGNTDWEIAKILARADIEATEMAEYTKELEKNIATVKEAREIIKAKEMWFPQTKIGIEGIDMRYVAPYLLERFAVFVHAIDIEQLEKDLQTFTKAGLSLDPFNSLLSTSWWYAGNFATYELGTDGVIVEIKDTMQIITAKKFDTNTGRKKGFTELFNFLFGEAHQERRGYFAEQLKKCFELKPEEYGELIEILSKYKSLDEIPEDEKFKGKKVKETMSEMLKDEFINTDAKRYNEIVIQAPKVIGVFHKGKTEISKSLKKFAKEMRVPIFIMPIGAREGLQKVISETFEKLLKKIEREINRDYAQMLKLNQKLSQCA